MEYTIGIDVGGTNIKAVAMDRAGTWLQRTTRPTGDFAAWSAGVRALIGDLETAQGEAASGIGLATPGVIAADGLSVATTAGKMPGLDGVNWTDFLARPAPVPLLNDAHAALLGETWIGAGTGFRNVILLTLGTGVGGAILADGRLLRGWRGLAGHLGHVTLNADGLPSFMKTPGALESAIGDGYLAERCGGRYASTAHLVAASEAGDPFAVEVWRRSIRLLACAIGSFINALDPEAVIIGGGIARAGEALFNPLAHELESLEYRLDERRVQILPAQLGEWAGACGAARNAWIEPGN